MEPKCFMGNSNTWPQVVYICGMLFIVIVLFVSFNTARKLFFTKEAVSNSVTFAYPAKPGIFKAWLIWDSDSAKVQWVNCECPDADTAFFYIEVSQIGKYTTKGGNARSMFLDSPGESKHQMRSHEF